MIAGSPHYAGCWLKRYVVCPVHSLPGHQRIWVFHPQNHVVGSLGKMNDLLELGVLFLWGGHHGIRVDMVQFWRIGAEFYSI
jgi:hypothetical protein